MVLGRAAKERCRSDKRLEFAGGQELHGEKDQGAKRRTCIDALVQSLKREKLSGS